MIRVTTSAENTDGTVVLLREKFTRCAPGAVKVQVADLSHIAGFNQRTLLRAFREVCGIGPYRYLQHLRLSEVKRVLLSEEVTVTQAAMRFGFVELGRFGVQYKKIFGETPSETRRRRQAVREVSPSDPPLVPNEVEETVS